MSKHEPLYCGEVSDQRRVKLVRRLSCPVAADAQRLQHVLQQLQLMQKHPPNVPSILHYACKKLDLFACE